MTATQAARVIGCSVSHVRTLIRQGKLHAQRIRQPGDPPYRYDVSSEEARRYRDTPQTRGYPRGQKRKD